MKIALSQVYNNKPYYTIRHEDGKRSQSFGYEQTKEFIESALAKGEEIDVEDTKFLDEHNKLIELIKSKINVRRKNEKNKNQ